MNTLPDWSAMFPEPVADLREFHLLRKRGEPLLLLPLDPALATQCVGLYPAQTTKARVIRSALRLALGLRLPLGFERVQLPVGAAGLGGFLRELSDEEMRFGVLLGNPKAAGRRLICLLFGKDKQPVAVVKAGATERARELLQAELNCFQRNLVGRPGTPKLLGSCSVSELSALATNFVPGEAPPFSGTEERLMEFLSAWLVPRQTMPLRATPAWQRLARSSHPLFSRIDASLGDLEVARCLMHGDFAPWNLREQDGLWTALDWERGEEPGVPGWDAIHFIVQSLVLIGHCSAPAICIRLNALFTHPAFQTYAKHAGIAGHERAVTAAYFLHASVVWTQTEGVETIRELSGMDWF